MRQCRRAARLQTLSLMDYNTPHSTSWGLVVSQGLHHIALMTTNHQEASFNGIPALRKKLTRLKLADRMLNEVLDHEETS